MIFDNLGITIVMAELPSWEYHRLSMDVFYGGTNKLMRFYAKHIRRWLFPDWHKELLRHVYQSRRQVEEEQFAALAQKGAEMGLADE